MLNNIYKFIKLVLYVFITALVILLVTFCILIPEKTKDGNYTDGYEYWTSDTYFNENFN